jgi:leucyl/phenylalanyl-tRNA---protein transferase
LKRHLREVVTHPDFIVRATSDIGEVMHTAGALRDTTWITPEMERAYIRLGRHGYALAYEVRRAGTLIGGLYGVRVGGLFAAESMFHRETDASKVALVSAVTHQFAHGATLFDVQFLTPHLESMGAFEISRSAYLGLLRKAVASEERSGGLQVRELQVPELPVHEPQVPEQGPEAPAETNILPWVAGRLNLL